MAAKIQSIEPVIKSRNVGRTLEFYGHLGFAKAFVDSEESPTYAGIHRDGIFMFVQWHDSAEWGYPVDQPAYRFVVDNIDALHASFVATGSVTDMKSPAETAWGTYEFHVRDPDGNVLQFYKDL